MQLVNIDREKLVAAAGGDPWQVNAALQHGTPAEIDSLAHAFHSAGQSATEAGNAFAHSRQRFENAWNRDNGEHPISDCSQVQLAFNSLGVQAAQLPAIAVDLETIAASLAGAQRSSATFISTLEKQLTQVDQHLGNLIDLEQNPRLTDEERWRISVAIQDLDQKAVGDTTATLQQVIHIRDDYAGTLRSVSAKLPTDGCDAMLGPPDANPDAANKWWNSLSPEQKTRLATQHSPELGNLNGIPVDVRNEINRAVMTDDLNRVRDLANLHGLSVNDVLGDPVWYGLSATDLTRYNNARRTEQGLTASADAVDEQNQHPDVYLLRYQPDTFGGDGAAAIAMGNPDTAANTAILVKGLGSGVKQGSLANPDGLRLYNEANRADWEKDTAVVTWVGYDAPDLPTDPALYEPHLARTGGRALAADVNALAVTHRGPPTHMTVVGHSYGSTTVADAAAAFGMHTNDIVLVGSPGADLAHSAADFHLSFGGHLYVGDASQDEVGWLGEQTMKTPLGGIGLGQDPAIDGFGSVRFKAEVPGYSLNPFYDHSHYFDLGSESLFSIGDVVSGHGDALEHDGMTAGHRGEYGLPAFVDPEVGRQATTGHRHSAPVG